MKKIRASLVDKRDKSWRIIKHNDIFHLQMKSGTKYMSQKMFTTFGNALKYFLKTLAVLAVVVNMVGCSSIPIKSRRHKKFYDFSYMIQTGPRYQATEEGNVSR